MKHCLSEEIGNVRPPTGFDQEISGMEEMYSIRRSIHQSHPEQRVQYTKRDFFFDRVLNSTVGWGWNCSEWSGWNGQNTLKMAKMVFDGLKNTSKCPKITSNVFSTQPYANFKKTCSNIPWRPRKHPWRTPSRHFWRTRSSRTHFQKFQRLHRRRTCRISTFIGAQRRCYLLLIYFVVLFCEVESLSSSILFTTQNHHTHTFFCICFRWRTPASWVRCLNCCEKWESRLVWTMR